MFFLALAGSCGLSYMGIHTMRSQKGLLVSQFHHKNEASEITMTYPVSKHKIAQYTRAVWRSPLIAQTRATAARWLHAPYSGTVVLLFGTAFTTLFILLIDHTVVDLPNPGLIYLPFVAMLAYHWSVRHAAIATLLQL